MLLGRVDLVVLAAPFALGTAYALRRRPDALPQVTDRRRRRRPGRGRRRSARAVTVGNPGPVDYDLAVVRTRVSPWLRIDRAGFAGDGATRRRAAAGRGRPAVRD